MGFGALKNIDSMINWRRSKALQRSSEHTRCILLKGSATRSLARPQQSELQSLHSERSPHSRNRTIELFQQKHLPRQQWLLIVIINRSSGYLEVPFDYGQVLSKLLNELIGLRRATAI